MPTLKLTDVFVDAVKPPPRGRAEYIDTVARGLMLRVTDQGVKSWALRYRTATGKRRRLTLGVYDDLSLKAARRQAESERGKIANGADPAATKKAARQRTHGDTIADLAKEYIARHAKPNKRSWEEDQRQLDVEILPKWKNKKVRELTRRDVRVLLDAIVDRGAPVMANRIYKTIAKMLNFAISRDWVESNVAAKLPKPGGDETSRSRVLTEDEIRLVWAACATERPMMCALLRLRFLTAQRGGELAKLRSEDIDGDWITIPESVSKNGKAHRVPLSPAAQQILDNLPRFADTPYLFPGRPTKTPTGEIIIKPTGEIKQAGRRVADQVLKTLQQTDPTITQFDFRGHDMRRTASTEMAKAGIPGAHIARVLNHSDRGPRVTQIYNRYEYDAEKRIALETWARRLEAILTQKPTQAVVPFARVRRTARNSVENRLSIEKSTRLVRRST